MPYQRYCMQMLVIRSAGRLSNDVSGALTQGSEPAVCLCDRETNNSRARAKQQAVQQQLLQRPPPVKKRLSGAASQRADLLQVAMASQQAQCVRLVVDALLEGRFSKVSMVLHMYEALQALIHDPQVCLSGFMRDVCT